LDVFRHTFSWNML